MFLKCPSDRVIVGPPSAFSRASKPRLARRVGRLHHCGITGRDRSAWRYRIAIFGPITPRCPRRLVCGHRCKPPPLPYDAPPPYPVSGLKPPKLSDSPPTPPCTLMPGPACMELSVVLASGAISSTKPPPPPPPPHGWVPVPSKNFLRTHHGRTTNRCCSFCTPPFAARMIRPPPPPPAPASHTPPLEEPDTKLNLARRRRRSFRFRSWYRRRVRRGHRLRRTPGPGLTPGVPTPEPPPKLAFRICDAARCTDPYSTVISRWPAGSDP